MTYQVELAPAAKRQIKKLPPDAYKRIIQRLEELKLDPRPAKVAKLEGEEDLYRVRVGDYRIVYQVRERVLQILVVKVKHRRDVYRK
jgi:mRNA interferase RelE/StbE